LFRFQASAAGIHHVGVTGFYDSEFNGAAGAESHVEVGDYYLSVARVNPAVLGGNFADTDPANSALAGADLIAIGATGAAVAVSQLAGAGDVDFYRLDLQAGDVLSAMTAPLAGLSGNFDVPDTMLALFDSSGVMLVINDDAGDLGEDPAGVLDSDFPTAGDVFGSALRAVIPATDTYYLGVTGFGDDGFVGAHGEGGSYGLLVSVPEPGSIGLVVSTLLALAGAAAIRKRRA
jgi:hypothetical protein